MYLNEATSSRAIGTAFHPGVNHAHAPTGRWADVQKDSASQCQHLRDTVRKDPGRAPAAAQGIMVECACSRLSPRNVARTVRNTLMSVLPLAQRHLDHYIDGTGSPIHEDFETVIRRDRKVRAKLASYVSKYSKGHFKLHQSDFDIKDFQFAFGAIDRVDFEVDRKAGLVHVWFQDRYEWHPVGYGYTSFPDDSRRPTNCVHAAMVELKRSGAKDYWMIGDTVLPLSVVLGTSAPVINIRDVESENEKPARHFESDYERRTAVHPPRSAL